jgi:hypothetical protein
LRNLYDFNPVLTTKPQSTTKIKEPVFYISAGSNFPLNPYGNLYVQPNLGERNSLVIYADHQSYLSKLKNVEFNTNGYAKRGKDKIDAPSNLSNLGLKYRLAWRELEIGSNININSAMFSYFGNKEYNTSFLKDSSSHKYTISSFNFYSKSNRKDHNRLSYNFSVNYSLLNDNTKFMSTHSPTGMILNPNDPLSFHKNSIEESNLEVSFETGIGFANNNKISVATNYQSSNLKRGALIEKESDRSNLLLHPKYNFKRGRWDFELGIKYNQWWVNEIDDYNIYLNAKARFQISPNRLYAYAFIDGKNNMMSYQQLLSISPWISPNSRIENIEQPVIARVGLKGKISEKISFNIYGGYYEYKNQLYFYPQHPDYSLDMWLESALSSSMTTEPNAIYSYNSLYGPEEKRFGIGGEILFSSKDFEARVTTDIFSFKDQNNFSDRHYNYSPVEINGYFRYNFRDRVILTSDFTFKNKAPIITSQYDDSHISAYPGPKKQTPSYLNLNTKISYLFNKNLTFFVTFNNILNSDIIFISHNSMPGINGGFGISYKF